MEPAINPWTIYWIDFFNTIRVGLLFTAAFSTILYIALTIASFIIHTEIEEKNIGEMGKMLDSFVKKLGIVVMITVPFAIFFPSQEITKAMITTQDTSETSTTNKGDAHDKRP